MKFIISIKKNMNRRFAKSNIFQVKESLSPINIPIPTPASDWGGPIAWLSSQFDIHWPTKLHAAPTRKRNKKPLRLRGHSIRPRAHPNRMQGWESVCWLVIGIPLVENRKIGSVWHIHSSCFWSISNSYPSFRRFFTEDNGFPTLLFDFSCFSEYYYLINSKIKSSKA